jgi:predicted lipid-binding transport protein (Tim44 family)
MKKLLSFMIVALSLGLASLDAEAAKRFGGGGNLGKQRATPTQREATPSAAPATPNQAAKPATPSPSATPPIAPKPSFMQRWGGLLAGLGIGMLLSSLFGAQMGPIVGMLLAAVLGFLVIGFLMRLFMGRKQPAGAPAAAFERREEPAFDSTPASTASDRFSGIGARVNGAGAGSSVTAANDASMVLGGPVEPFLRVAKTSFIRLQAANDAGDLDDVRDYTTPEMFAEIAMQVRDRGGVQQKTEVVSVDAAITDAAIEGDYAYASVRFWGLIREAPGANPEPFDEIWHVRRRANNPKDAWLIAGIQQTAA